MVIELKSGSEDAFDYIYYKYVNLIFYVIFKIVKNRQDAEDITQETLIKMMESIHTFNENNNFKYWLLQIAKNKALNFIKVKKRVVLNSNHVNSLEDKEKYSETDDFDEIMKEYEHIVTKDEFDIITLRIYHNMKFKEIAELYGKTESSVNNIYHRGISKIKKEWSVSNEKTK